MVLLVLSICAFVFLAAKCWSMYVTSSSDGTPPHDVATAAPAEDDSAREDPFTHSRIGEDKASSNSSDSPLTLPWRFDAKGLEFLVGVPPLLLYQRPKRVSWSRSGESVADRPSPVKIACLYAGFMRDFERMYGSCHEFHSAKYCGVSKKNKMYGNQKAFIIAPSNCDVFISTWHIRGAGRFSTSTYNMRDIVPVQAVKRIYGDQLAVLHLQNYTPYMQAWDYMHVFSRDFPQTKPTVLGGDPHAGIYLWAGVPVTNHYLRRNDYSQSYKQWCVLQLVKGYGEDYDLYFRLRADLRAVMRLFNFQFSAHTKGSIEFSMEEIPNVTQGIRTAPGTQVAVRAGMLPSHARRTMPSSAQSEAPQSSEPTSGSEDGSSRGYAVARTHIVGPGRLHVNNFDVGDFGFLGPPQMIDRLGDVWKYCLRNSSERVPFVRHSTISEYNLMVWRIVFDNQWLVDSGGRYLWVSRRLHQKTRGRTK